MAGVRHIQNAFVAGEINPLLEGRTDTDQYAFGLALCENFQPVNEGPLIKRPGFIYICDADTTTSWLGTFKYSITQEYVIEWGELKARFYTNGGRIETSPGVPYQLTTPYTAAEVSTLSTQQSNDRLYIDHPAHPPGSLLRLTATTFSITTSTFKNGPFKDVNTDEVSTVTCTGTLTVGGSVTITAVNPIFAAGHVGGLLKLEAMDFSTIKAWQPGARDVPVGTVWRSDGKAYTSLTSSNAGNITPVHDSGAEWDGPDINMGDPGSPTIYGVKWQYRHDKFGIVRITGFTSSTVVTATVERRLPDSLGSVPTHKWSLGAFSIQEGWPSLVQHAFGRQVHIRGFDVCASVVGDFGGGTVNFQNVTSSGLVAADLAFRRRLETEDPPLWAIIDKRGLLLGTASKELVVSALNPQAAVTGENIRNDPESFYGSEEVTPVQIGTRTNFVERGGRRVRSTGYDIQSDRYVPEDLTAAARHLTTSGIVQLAWHRVPHALLYGVRGDGQLTVHGDTRLQIKGWSRTVLGGGAKALSLATVFGADGKTDELWLLVERTRSDGVKREIWKQAPWRELGDDQADAFFVDAGTIQTIAGGTTSFTGALHLKNKDIAVLVNGGVVPGITVSATGTFSLPAAVVPADPYTLVIGLAYTATAKTLRPNAQLGGGMGTSQGLLQRLRKVALRVLDTFGLSVAGSNTPDLAEQLLDRSVDDPMDGPPSLVSGLGQKAIETAHDTDGQAIFTSAVPLPAIVTMAMLGLEMDGRNA